MNLRTAEGQGGGWQSGRRRGAAVARPNALLPAAPAGWRTVLNGVGGPGREQSSWWWPRGDEHRSGASPQRMGTLGMFGTEPAACPQRPPLCRGRFLTHGAFSLSAAEALASRTPYRQPDLQGQDWAGETPASSRSPPATSPPPGWGCWAPVGYWAPPSAAPPPAPPSSSKADRLVTLRGASSFSILSPVSFLCFFSSNLSGSPLIFPSSVQAKQARAIYSPPPGWVQKRGLAGGGGQTRRRGGER